MTTRRRELAARRKALGFTQEALAHELNVDFRTVRRWEQGTLTPQPWRRHAIAKVLDLSLTELAGLLNPPEIEGIAPVVDELDLERQPRSTIRLSIGSPGYLDELVVHLRDQWHVLVRTDNLLGPRFALDAVRTQIAIIEEMLPLSDSRRDELVTLAATYAESAAWLYEDTGQMAAATFWVGRALEWASEAGNDLLMAWALFRRSQHAAASHDAQRTITLARAAGRGGDSLPTPMRAAIAQQEAHGHALAGDELKSQRAIDRAHQWGALDNAGDARAGHGSFCTEAYLELQRAHCWTSLGKPQRAIAVYEKVLPALPPVYRRDSGMACSRFAQAYANAGQPEAAARIGREALAIARESGSVRTENEILRVGRSLEEHQAIGSVGQLLRELSPAPRP